MEKTLIEKYRHKAVLITGASSGIGKDCALYLDRLGYQVFAGVRQQIDADHLLTQASVRLTPLLLDITDPDSIQMALKTVRSNLEESLLVGLINNAGIVIAGPIEFLPLEEIRKQFEVNVIGQIAVIQAFLGLLRNSQGRILNIGSDNGRVSAPFLGPYCASKFAMEAFTDALRVEVRPWGIGVCIIEPGTVNTPIWEKSIAISDEMVDRLPDVAHRLYGVSAKAARDTAQQLGRKGFPARKVSKTVARALVTRSMKARYTVGLDAKLNIFLSKYLPTWLMDRLIERFLGL